MISEQVIKDYIMTRNNVSVIELCDHFDISESTVRRVLTKLEDKNVIKRYHGGAYSAMGMMGSDTIQARMKINEDRKLIIAEKASSLIEEGSTVILLGGTTIHSMCRFLKKKKLTIITNSLIVFSELQYEENMRIVLLGGLFNPKEYELGGIITNTGMRHIRADYIFMGSMGFDSGQGFTTKDLESLELYQTCISSSKQVYVLADSSKYNAGGTAITARYEDVHGLITDDGLDSDAITLLSSKELKIIIAQKEN